MNGAREARQRLALVLSALRHLRERESDLIYEAYYDAFNRVYAEYMGEFLPTRTTIGPPNGSTRHSLTFLPGTSSSFER